MSPEEMEEVIDEIVKRRWEKMRLETLSDAKKTLKLAVLDGYKAGMEEARKVYTS